MRRALLGGSAIDRGNSSVLIASYRLGLGKAAAWAKKDLIIGMFRRGNAGPIVNQILARPKNSWEQQGKTVFRHISMF